MLDRKSELEAIKAMNLTVIAAAAGYEIDKKKSTRQSVLMTNGADKIVVSRKGSTYVYFSVSDSASRGTAIDFAQNVMQPGCSMGEARQLLRPFLSSGYRASVERKTKIHSTSDIQEQKYDFDAVKRRYSKLQPITGRHRYLCDERGIPEELLKQERLRRRIRRDPRGSVAFPHWGIDEQGRRLLTGYEIVGPSLKLFSKGGRRGLFISNARSDDNTLAVSESGLDAISYLSLKGAETTRVASVAGALNQQVQPQLLRLAIEHLGEGRVVAAFDNDEAGDRLTQQLHDIVAGVSRSAFEFKDDRPKSRGCDWNKVLQEEAICLGRFQQQGIGLGR